jgi:adenylate kinase family enzyme
MKVKKIICLYGGPGSGKSTVCAGLFYHLKLMGFECEMNREYIKEWVWEDRKHKSGDQSYFFAKMARKERIYIDNKLDFIITDSPLILCHFYGMKFDKFEQMTNTSLSMLKNHHQYCIEAEYKIDHFLLNRTKRYSPAGRYQDEFQAKEIDQELRAMLDTMNIKFNNVDADINCVDNIIKTLQNA